MKVLIYCEHSNGKVKKGSLELLSNAAQWGVEVHAIALGAPGSLEALTAEINQYAPHSFHQAEHASLAQYAPEAYAKVVAEAAKNLQADAVLTSVSVQAKDFFPRLAVKLDTGMASDCTELSANGGSLQAKRPLYSGKCYASVDFSQAKPAIASVRPNALGMKPAKAGSAQVQKISADPGTVRAQVKELVAKAGAANKVPGEIRVWLGGSSLAAEQTGFVVAKP